MKRLGYFAKLFVGAGGSSPTMTDANELKLVVNANVNGSVELVDATDRSTKGYKSNLAGLKDFQIEGTAHWDNTIELLNLFREAFIQHKAIAVRASDGSGGGIDADFIVSNWTENQQNNQPLGLAIISRWLLMQILAFLRCTLQHPAARLARLLLM